MRIPPLGAAAALVLLTLPVAGAAGAQQPPLEGPPSGLPQPDTAVSIVAPEGRDPPPGVAGDHLMYIGTYGRAIYVLDEATERVVDRIALRTGIPRSLTLNVDRTRFYVVDVSYENVEVVDIASRRTLEVIHLGRGDETVRIWGLAVAPGDAWAVLMVRSYRALPDRFEVGPMRLVQYDLERGEVVREIPWPGDRERESVSLRFSRDGRWLYVLMDEIRVYDTETFAEVDRWAFEEAVGDELRDLSFGFPESVYDEPGVYTGLFRVTDPVQDRRLMGVARVDLDAREVDFFPVGPHEGGLGFAVAPGGGRAHGLKSEVGRYEFWTFDLEGQRVLSRTAFRGRPRMWHEVSSSGEVVYVYNAGNTIDLYEADGYRYIRTILLDVDTTSRLIVLPGPGEDGAVPGRDGG